MCALWSVTEPNQKNRNKPAKSQINQLAARRAGGKGVSSLENDDLDTGEGLPINVSPQLTSKIPLRKARNTPNQLTDGVPGKPPVAHLHVSISHSSSLIHRDALPGCYLCALGISPCSWAQLSPHLITSSTHSLSYHTVALEIRNEARYVRCQGCGRGILLLYLSLALQTVCFQASKRHAWPNSKS